MSEKAVKWIVYNVFIDVLNEFLNNFLNEVLNEVLDEVLKEILNWFPNEIPNLRSMWYSATASVGWILGRCCSGKGSIHSSESSNDDQDAHQKKVAVYATTTQLLEFSRGPLADTIKTPLL